MTALGGYNAPGIGGGFYSAAGTLRIEDGTVTATGGSYGAGIGCGAYAASGSVTIAGGDVTATGGLQAAGIGGGYYADGGGRCVIAITGGTVTAVGGEQGSGIGGGYLTSGGTISISGGAVAATGGQQAAGIGGGYARSGGTITISGGTVTAEGGRNGAGIGGGVNSGAGTIAVTGGTILAARGGEGAAGIGAAGNDSASGDSIRISGGTIVEAQGGSEAAGIGLGSGRVDFCNGTVEITGGVILRAAGGESAAGIGGGRYGSIASLSITGGTVYPVAGSGASALGRGAGDSNRTGPVTVDGGAIYAAKNMVDPAATNQFDYAVFPVDFDIGLPTNKAVSVDLKLLGYIGYIWNNQYRSFSEYGARDLYTDENGVLRLWLPSTAPNVFTATITMEDGSVHYFVFQIEKDGTVVQADYLVVNGEYVTDRANAIGTGWFYTTNNCLVTLTGDAIIEGISTNGAHRLFVNRGGASHVTLQGLDLRVRNERNASAVVVSNNCTLSLEPGLTNRIAATGQYAAGIEVVSDVALTICSSADLANQGTLAVQGGEKAAGLGSR